MVYIVLITGASSGLGLAFVKHYASQPDTEVIGFDIQPWPADLSSSEVDMWKVDITNEELPQVCRTIFEETFFNERCIDLVIHCAGVRGLVPSVIAEKRDVAAAETYSVMDHSTMMKTLEINTFGTFNVIKALLPHLKHSPRPKLVLMTSRMGSIQSNSAGGGYAYRASKAALNAIVKSFSIDEPDTTFLLVHPGRVETGLVEWKEEGAFTVNEVLSDCVSVIENASKEDSGRFVDRWGADIPW